jgi:very-short-patch-repair endonuclease
LPKNPNHNYKFLKKYRKKLRNNLTSAEARLWSILKNKQLKGRKFRRQHSIDNFIVDFYCPKEKLVIELDGQVHFNPVMEEKDSKRDKILNSYGITVLRFENKMVFENQEIVLKAIKDKFHNKLL